MARSAARLRKAGIGADLAGSFTGGNVTFRLKHKDSGSTRYFHPPPSALRKCEKSHTLPNQGSLPMDGLSFSGGMVPAGSR